MSDRFRFVKNEGFKTLVFYFVLMQMSVVGCTSRERAVLNQPAVIVNGHELSTKDFAERLALKLKGFDALYAKDEQNLSRAKENVVQSYILEMIARDYARKVGLTVNADEIDKEVAKIRSRYPDDFAFRRALADDNTSMEKWRSDLEFTLLQKKIFARITEKIPEPTDAQLKPLYEAKKSEFQKPARVRLRQIVLSKEDDAKRITDELAGGADFGKLAKQFSIAPEATENGDTGWIEKGTLDVFDPAFKMKVGERSKILKSPYGYHIYEVLKKEPEAHLSFTEAKAKLRARWTEAESQKVFSAWLEENIRHADVRRNDELIKAIKVTTRAN